MHLFLKEDGACVLEKDSGCVLEEDGASFPQGGWSMCPGEG